MSSEEILRKFLELGLSEQKVKETMKNDAVTSHLYSAINEISALGFNPKDYSTLLFYLSSKLKPQISSHIPFLVKYIANKKLESPARIDAALEHLLSNAHKALESTAFEKDCGIGLVITPEDVEKAVEKALNKYKTQVIEKRYRFNTGLLLQEVRNSLKWADFKDVKNEIDVQLLYLLGPKTDDDRLPVKKAKEPSKPEPAEKSAPKANRGTETACLTIPDMISKLSLHKPGENFKTDGYVITPNTETLIQEHLKFTGGKVRTRFPPEPNGILHIGHAKAININFGYAAYHKGICFLRFDDTNPEKEEEKFFRGIMDMVEWLGYKPYKITHSSDYFDQLHEWAVKLIQLGHAYVCHQKQEEMQGFNAPASPWRDRPIEENLKLFEDMRRGKFDEGECTLRMKITLEEGKQDPVAYRIKYLPHPRVGDKWCIYPTYDYTHCLCDSIEHITHSLCTKEFQSRRSSYYWLCNALNIYCPVQWEYGRLNMNYTVVSKRKIAKLIDTKVVKDWDDPRLFTLTALRRRGFPPEAINRFCAQMGVTGAQAVVDPGVLEACGRDILNLTAPRTMVVIDPVEVQIVPEVEGAVFSVPDFPAEPSKSSHSVQFCSKIFIDRSDFKEESEPGYKRLTKNQPVGLRYTPYLLKVSSLVYEGETVKKIIAEAIAVTKDNKPKAFIHWVSKPVPVVVRLYKNLFAHKHPEDPNEVPNGFLSDVVDDSLTEKTALADSSLLSASKPWAQFQFERVGYFNVDPDSSSSNVIFNRTLNLKEDSGKSAF